MRAHVAIPVLAAVLPVVLVGCGDSDSSNRDAPTSASPEDEVRAFAEDYLDAFRTGDPAFCDRRTQRYRDEQDAEDSDLGSCEEAFEAVASWREEDPEDWEQTFGGPVREVRVDGDRATFLYGDEGDGNAIHLVRQGDGWLIDGDESEYSYKASLTTPEDEARWRDVVCDLEEGMSRDEVIALMGEPTVVDAHDLYWHGPGEDSPEYFAILDDDDTLTDYGTGGRCRH